MGGHEVRRTPAHAVDRPVLRAQLDAGLPSPLSLIVAPAGAGKTVLLSQWERSHPELPLAWLDISPAHADPGVFARQLTDAVGAAAPRFRAPAAPVVTAEARLGERYLEDLAGALGEIGPIVVVLDDLDRLSGSAVLTDLWRLVDLLPDSSHFVFASRTDLQLGWSRQRIQHGLVELRQQELAFDQATTAQVLERITGTGVAEEIAAAVTAGTEGWAAGVQLTALTMRAAPDPDRVVRTLSGTDRLVVDYLSEEVLDALEPPRRAALIQLAVPDEVCPQLVEAIAGVDGAAFLAQLERDSMFIVPVIDRPGWYRFHRLFRDLLLLRLRAHDGGSEPSLLTNAARWHLAAGDQDTAMEYLIRAHAWDAVMSHVLTLDRSFYDGSRMATVARWLSSVPAPIRAHNIDAELLLALADAMSGHAVRAIDALRMLLGTDRLSAGQRQIALAYLAACVQFDPHPETFVVTARHALVELARHPEADVPDLLGLSSRPLLLIVSRVSLGRAQLFLGDIPEARHNLHSALKALGMAYRPYRVHTLGSLALAEAIAGRLAQATELADEALALAAESDLLSHPSPADAYLARALIAVQRDEPETGALALHEGALLASANQRTQLMWIVWLLSGAPEPDSGDPSSTAPPGPRPHFVREATTALTMRRARLRGAPVPLPAPSSTWSYVAFEEVAAHLSAGRAAEAHRRLSEVSEPDADMPLHRVEQQILRGWLCALQGRPQASREHLRAALEIAEPEWLVHPFARAGAAVADLVDAIPGPRSAFRDQVIRRARVAASAGDVPIAGLTPRERELLSYLPTRLTIADIAGRSFVSTNTIKTHLGHIYRKLDVPGRDAAVARAAELGLLEPDATASTH